MYPSRFLSSAISLTIVLVLSACSDSVVVSQDDENAMTSVPEPAAALPLIPGEISYDIVAVDASDYQDPNYPENTIDKRIESSSRWSAEGRENVWLELDLGTPRLVNAIDIAFLKSQTRNSCFNIETSNNGKDWTAQRSNIVSNKQSVTSIPETNTRYVRFIGLGNSDNKWNSITEIAAKYLPPTGKEETRDGVGGDCPSIGEPILLSENPTGSNTEVSYDIVAVDASDYQDPNYPENAIDKKTADNARWSAKGRNNVWLELDLGTPNLINALDISFLKAEDRKSCFNIETSNDGNNWVARRSNIVSNGTRVNSIPETNARYVRFVGLGNSDNEWNSILEIEAKWLPPTGDEDTSNGIGGECTNGSESVTVPEPILLPEPPTREPEPVTYNIVSVNASDFQNPNFPENVIDQRTEDDSRWSAEGRTNVWLELDLGTPRLINTLDILFLKSQDRNTCFHIETSNDRLTWKKQRSNIVSNGDRINSIPETDTRYVRFVGLGNSENEWNSIIEIAAKWLPPTGNEDTRNGVAGVCSSVIEGGSDTTSDSPTQTGTGEPPSTGGPSANRNPVDNFDLSYWKITYPDASETYPPAVIANEFYTDSNTGAMVFRCLNRGERTSNSTKYARSELREMLRRTNDSIGTKSLGNNWVTSVASTSDQSEAGGVDGNMKATVAVDAVSTTASSGDEYMLGRVIVGQIHAVDDEPFKIFYRKMPGHSKGSVYFSYEDSKVENYYEFFGSRDTNASNPTDGIALGEKWSYEVDVRGRDMTVTVTKEDGTFKSKKVTWGSEYDDDQFYFKAGNYNQNNGGEVGDYAQVSIFALEATHD